MTRPTPGASTHLAEALIWGEAVLAEHAIDEPRREARLALSAATGLGLAAIIASPDRPLGEAASRYADIIARRARHEPLSRILGKRSFFGLDLALSSETLDPRPETEHLVEAALDLLANTEAPHVLDLGTGTGAIILALASARTDLTALGVDIAADAVATARANASDLGVAARLRFVAGDLYAALDGSMHFDLIVSNPPYIPTADLAGLMPEVRLFDPARALDGGNDGLDFYRRIIAGAARHLRAEGSIALEIGAGQSDAVRSILVQNGFIEVDILPDYAGIERVLTAKIRQ